MKSAIRIIGWRSFAQSLQVRVFARWDLYQESVQLPANSRAGGSFRVVFLKDSNSEAEHILTAQVNIVWRFTTVGPDSHAIQTTAAAHLPTWKIPCPIAASGGKNTAIL